MACAFAPSDENDVALACIGIILLEEEELVDAVVLKGCDLDDESDGTGEALFNDEVLLAPDLWGVSLWPRGLRVDQEALLTPSRRYRRSLRALSFIWSVSNTS